MFKFKKVKGKKYTTTILIRHTLTLYDLSVLFVSVYCDRSDIVDLAFRLTQENIYSLAVDELKNAGFQRAGFNVGTLNLDKRVDEVQLVFFLRFADINRSDT